MAESWVEQACSQGGSTIRAAWKLLGDIRIAHCLVDPLVDSSTSFSDIRDSSPQEALAL